MLPFESSSSSQEVLKARQKHLMCNPKHLFSLTDELTNLNETFSQMALLSRIKQFPQNVSVTIVKSPSDSFFSVKYLGGMKNKEYEKTMQSAYAKSIEHLETRIFS